MRSKQYGLVRSFYGWLAKVEGKRSKKGSGSILESHPTTIIGASKVSADVCAALEDTKWHEKAVHYRDLFAKIIEDGWKNG